MADQGKSGGNWGNCEGCRYFGREGQTGDERSCVQAELQKFQLQITGSSGCNRFEPAPASRDLGQEPSAPSIH